MSEHDPVDPAHGHPDDGTDARPVRPGPMLRRLAIVLAGVFVGLVLVDRAVAWWDADQGADGGEKAIVRHDVLVWTNRPHFENPQFETRLDRYGNRNPEIPEDAPLDEVRIAGFGASRFYGANGGMQSWIWNTQAEALLAAQAPPRVRILNGAVMAYSTLQACRRATMLLDALEPDLVFVVASPGAQMMLDPSAARDQVRFGDGPNDFVPADIAARWPDPLLPSVAAVHRAMSKGSAIYRRHRAKFSTEGADRAASIQRWTVSSAERSPEVERMLGSTLDELVALRVQCERRGIELRVLVLPETEMGSDKIWDAYLRGNQQSGAPPLGTPREEPARVLESLLRERGLATWNFQAEVDVIASDRPRHTTEDNAHFSAEGHAVIARGLLRRLREDGLLERLAARRAAAPRTRPFGPSPFTAADN